jgi:predicted transcriptional regulator
MLSPRNAGTGGPVPKFSDYHIWKALTTLDETEPVGRKKLASDLKIGEGSTRTILNMLREHSLITIDKSGIRLTKKGEDSKSIVNMKIKRIQVSDITIGDYDCVVHVPQIARKISFGCEERDIAIKAGATGATTLVCSGGRLVFPGSNFPVEEKVESVLRNNFDIRNEDVIIIGTAEEVDQAEVGAVTAGIKLVGGLQMNRELRDILTPRSTGNELLSLAFAIHDLVGGLPVCAKSRDNLGIRIENGAVIDNAYTGLVLEEVIDVGTTIRKIAVDGPYKGIRVIVTPVELDNRVIAAIGVVDIRSMAGINNLIRLRSDDNE